MQRVLAMPPIPPKAHTSGTTFEINLFNCENCIENVENIWVCRFQYSQHIQFLVEFNVEFAIFGNFAKSVDF